MPAISTTGIGAKNLPRRSARGAEHDHLEKLKVLPTLTPTFDLVMFPLDPAWQRIHPRGRTVISAIHTKTFAPDALRTGAREKKR